MIFGTPALKMACLRHFGARCPVVPLSELVRKSVRTSAMQQQHNDEGVDVSPLWLCRCLRCGRRCGGVAFLPCLPSLLGWSGVVVSYDTRLRHRSVSLPLFVLLWAGWSPGVVVSFVSLKGHRTTTPATTTTPEAHFTNGCRSWGYDTGYDTDDTRGALERL